MLWPGGREAVGLALALLLVELVLVVPEVVVVVAVEEDELLVEVDVVDGTPGVVVDDDPSHTPYAAWQPAIKEQYVSPEPQKPNWEQHCP